MKSRRLAVSGLATGAALLAFPVAASAHPVPDSTAQVLGVQAIPVGVAAQQVLPRGFHWRVIRHQVADCGGHQTWHHWAIVVWRGPGDEQSALFCPGSPWGNGGVFPS